MKREIMEVVAMSFETGHFSFESFEDFKREYPDFGKEGWEYYCELVNLGPVGFYEEFKDDYDFDPMFVEEYGHYYDDDEDEEEILIDRLYHDASEDELRAMGCFGDEEDD